jgi:putative toxin-antitoxin system antitoxin component (TIGR02293 family)
MRRTAVSSEAGERPGPLAYADPSSLPASEPERIAIWLSLDLSHGIDEVSIAKCVRSGLSVKSATDFGGFLQAFHIESDLIPEATLRRASKSKKPLSKAHSERLYELSRVLDALGRAYRGDKERIQAFLIRPHPMLKGDTPFDLARSSSAGADAVLNLIQRAEAGVAA